MKDPTKLPKTVIPFPLNLKLPRKQYLKKAELLLIFQFPVNKAGTREPQTLEFAQGNSYPEGSTPGQQGILTRYDDVVEGHSY